MNAIASGTRFARAHGDLLQRLQGGHFAGCELTLADSGEITASYRGKTLASAFRPVVARADGLEAGRQASLRVRDASGAEGSPGSFFAAALDGAQLVQRDRLARTVHALNHFVAAQSQARLFLHVEQRLLATVRADHGAWFERVLREIGVGPERVGIVLPPTALEDPVTLVRAAISYRIRGYRVAARLRAASTADLAHVFLADPHYVVLDADTPGDCASRLVETLARRGIGVIGAPP